MKKWISIALLLIAGQCSANVFNSCTGCIDYTGSGSSGGGGAGVIAGTGNVYDTPFVSVASSNTLSMSSNVKIFPSSVTILGAVPLVSTETLTTGTTLYVSSGNIAGQLSATSFVLGSAGLRKFTTVTPPSCSINGSIIGACNNATTIAITSSTASNTTWLDYNGKLSLGSIGPNQLNVNGPAIITTTGQFYPSLTLAHFQVTPATTTTYAVLVATVGRANVGNTIGISTSTEIMLNGSAGTNGQVLTSAGAGTTPTWTTVSGGSPAGSATEIQYRNGSSFGAATNSAVNSDGTVMLSTNDVISDLTGNSAVILVQKNPSGGRDFIRFDSVDLMSGNQVPSGYFGYTVGEPTNSSGGSEIAFFNSSLRRMVTFDFSSPGISIGPTAGGIGDGLNTPALRVMGSGSPGSNGAVIGRVFASTNTAKSMPVDGLMVEGGVLVGTTTSVGKSLYAFYGTKTTTLTIVNVTNAIVATDANGVAVSTTVDLGASNVGGILAAAREPAHTGDVTNSAGSLAMTAAASQPNIKTLTSSLTVTGVGGITVTQGVSASSVSLSTNSFIAGATFYQSNNGTLAIGKIIWADGTTQVSSPTAGGGGGITALTGDVSAAGSGSVAATLASIVTADQYGNSSTVPVITFDAKGRITAVSSATISASGGDNLGSGVGIYGVATTTGGFTSQVSVSSLVVTGRANASPTTVGSIDYDTTKSMLVTYGAAVPATISRVLYTSAPIADILVSTTITTNETPFSTSFTFPANFFTAGKSIRITMGVEFIATATIPTSLSKWRFQKSGPTNVAFYTSTAASDAAQSAWNQRATAIVTIMCQTTGASGQLSSIFMGNGITPLGTFGGSSFFNIDTTAAQTLQYTLTYGASSNTNFTRLNQMLVEELN
jgi:hypothetical protein